MSGVEAEGGSQSLLLLGRLEGPIAGGKGG